MRVSCQQAHLWLIEPWPVRRPLMRNGPLRCLTDQASVFRERASPMPRRPWFPGLAPPCKLDLVNQQIHPARRGIDPNAVAVAYQRQRPADKGLRRNIADAHPARRTGEAPVGDQGNLLAHPLAVDKRGHPEHFAHAGTADRTFVADHQHLAGDIVAVADRFDTGLFVLEYPGRALKTQASQAGNLDDGTIGTEIAL